MADAPGGFLAYTGGKIVREVIEMSYTDWHFAERLMSLSVEEELGRAESHRLRSLAAGGHRGWLVSQACRMLGQLGTQMVIAGERLKRFYIPEPQTLEGQISRSK